MENEQPLMEQIKGQHRALAILQMLQREPSYRINERVIADCLARFALGGTRSEIRSTFDVLEKLNLVKTDFSDTLMIISLTSRGADVALGKLIVEGVFRPEPEFSY